MAEYPSIVTMAAVFVFGAVIGSFLNTVVHRLPAMMTGDREGRYDLIRPRSHCPECSNPIKPWENIPLLSYALLRGRCSRCDAPIPAQYPLVELAAALAAVGLAWRFGPGWAAPAAFAFFAAGLCIALIDARHLLVPDALTLPLIAAGLLANGAGIFAPFQDAAIGAVGGFVSLWAIYQGIRLVTKREAMGFGDFKLFAAIGAWLGWQALPFVLFLACVVGSAVGIGFRMAGRIGPGAHFPFAPFLVLGGVVMMVWGAEITRLYWSFT